MSRLPGEGWGEWAERAWRGFWLKRDEHPELELRLPRIAPKWDHNDEWDLLLDIPPPILRAFDQAAGGRFPNCLQVLEQLYAEQEQHGFMAVWNHPEPFEREELRVIIRLDDEVLQRNDEREIYAAAVAALERARVIVDFQFQLAQGSLSCPPTCGCYSSSA